MHHRTTSHFALTPLALALSSTLLALPAHAQDTQRITVVGTAAPQAPSVAGFGDGTPLARTPLAAIEIDDALRRDAGVQRVADLTRTDAGLADAYNAEGYWSFLTVRGFTLDNRSNYRRDGLPINAETALPLEAVERLEVLKGTSGIQAGTSAPGGLVNLVVKRPERTLRSATLEARQGGSLLGAVDLAQRFGESERFGLRVNAAAERLAPQTRNAEGHRRVLAIAADARLAPGTRVEVEAETSHQSQPSVPGFSLLGSAVPDARTVDPRLNLNNQAWSLPVVFDADTASIRVTQTLAPDWVARVHAMTQRLRTDDRIAFPYGCSAEGADDRYCSDGSFDLYDFRSDGERRRTDALDLQLEGRARLAGLNHRVALGVLATRATTTFGPQVFNYAGTGTVDGATPVPPAPQDSYAIDNRSERGTELYLRDRVDLAPDWQLWAGLRHSRLTRDGVRQSFTTPWLALSWRLDAATTAYASWGQGVEAEAAPRLPKYTNAGQALAALKSRQLEAGLKHARNGVEGSLVAFAITRPQTGDRGVCDDSAGSCTRVLDGSAVHRGLEAAGSLRQGPWQLQASALALHARRAGAADAARNGLAPVNVPSRSLRLGVARQWGDALELRATLAHEGARAALPDHGAQIPSWTRLDLGARFEQRVGTLRVTWRAGLDNATDRRAWREAPYQFGHAYLFPLAPRSARLSVQIEG
ncbi:MAG TPA: TonB-dependent receptor [Burkholderiaceae bacterium]|nr:TonB-dependent receptor [Burkholderiaceae bacterium]